MRLDHLLSKRKVESYAFDMEFPKLRFENIHGRNAQQCATELSKQRSLSLDDDIVSANGYREVPVVTQIRDSTRGCRLLYLFLLSHNLFLLYVKDALFNVKAYVLPRACSSVG